MTRKQIMEIALRQSAADSCCSPEDFLRTENVVVPAGVSAHARMYLEPPQICDLVSYGANIVAACREDLIPDVESYLRSKPDIHRCFETPAIYELNRLLEKADARVCFMADYFLPDEELVYRAETECPFGTRLMRQPDFAELYVPEWSDALCADRKQLDVLGVGAYDGGKLIGLAACSADGEEMWHIGVNVLPEYRQKGVASALTNRLARAIFEEGKVPFYCAAWSNIRSVKNAIRSGFRPGWVQITAKTNEYIRNMKKEPETDQA